jgi:diazepam-binding inhibitor (GABA receptor modulating acyl-CoA-binding protein)
MEDVLDKNFEIAVNIVNNLKKKPSDNELLDVYKYFKQAKYGDNNSKQPSMFSFKDTAKWKSWESVKGMDSNTAKQKYIDLSMGLFENYGS